MKCRCLDPIVSSLIIVGRLGAGLWAAHLHHSLITDTEPMSSRTGNLRVLILCTDNSCRSQFAEAVWRHEAGDRFEVASAGVNPKGINPHTLRALEEINIPTIGLRSKHVDELDVASFDLIVTVCDHAQETCPTIPVKGRRLHWPLDDPPAARGSEAEVYAVFGRVHDEIRAKIRSFVQSDLSAI